MDFNPNADRQLRGILLRLVYVNQRAQRPRTNSTLLHAVVQREGYDFTGDDVLTQLQDLRDRGYLRYHEQRDRQKGRQFLFDIEITHEGRDLMDGRKQDAAVMTD